MEAFVLNKGRVAKAIFITFMVLLLIFLTIYLIGQIYNLFRLKSAFEKSFSDIKEKWRSSLSEMPFPVFEKNSFYYFDIKNTKDSSASLTAIYSPHTNDQAGGISFVNSKGESANLYEIMSFFSGLKKTTDHMFGGSEAVRDTNSQSIPLLSVNSYEATQPGETLKKEFYSLVSDIFSVPKINKSRLGFNFALLLSKMDVKPGKNVILSGGSKGRMYIFKAEAKHLENFIENITGDGSIRNSDEFLRLKTFVFEVLKNSGNGNFIFNIILHKGDVHSIECLTPRIFNSAYSICAEKGDTFGEIKFIVKNISTDSVVFRINGKNDEKNITLDCNIPQDKIDIVAIGDNTQAKLVFIYGTRLGLNLRSKKENEGYSIDFFSDSTFERPPFLNVYIVKEKREKNTTEATREVFGYSSLIRLYNKAAA